MSQCLDIYGGLNKKQNGEIQSVQYQCFKGQFYSKLKHFKFYRSRTELQYISSLSQAPHQVVSSFAFKKVALGDKHVCGLHMGEIIMAGTEWKLKNWPGICKKWCVSIGIFSKRHLIDTLAYWLKPKYGFVSVHKTSFFWIWLNPESFMQLKWWKVNLVDLFKYYI